MTISNGVKKTDAPRISVVIPVYNEEASVAPLHKELVSVLGSLGMSYEIIFVDDGSSDGTFNVLHKLSPVKVIRFTRNFGKSQALQAAFDYAEGNHIITLDGDLQDDPHEIPRMLKKADEGVALVCGWKQKRADSISKRLVSKVANHVTRWVTGVQIHDMNCCFKVYKRDVAKSLMLTGDMHRYIPSLVSAMGYSVDEVKVNHRPRKYGKSKYGFGRILNSLFDFFTLIFLRKFTDRPMHFFGSFGFLLSGVGVIILAYLTYLKLFEGEFLAGRPLLLLGVLLVIIGMQLLSLGFIGELIIRQSDSGSRNFVVRELIER